MHDTHLTGTWSEVQAEKDLLRAEFPLSTRRLEITVEQLMNKTSGQALELNKWGNLSWYLDTNVIVPGVTNAASSRASMGVCPIGKEPRTLWPAAGFAVFVRP